MKRTRLRFESIQQIVGGDGLSVLLLTDGQRERCLSVVCDDPMSQQFLMRLQNPSACRYMLPEVMSHLLTDGHDFEIMVYGIFEGQYQAVLTDTSGQRSTRLRMSDAILLSIISKIPLYIEENLMARQCTDFDEQATGIAIPINTMDTERLQNALRQAVDEENYELASKLRDEINKRSS